MKKITRIRLLNLIPWAVILSLSIHDGFLTKDENSFGQGQIRGFVIFIVGFLLVIYPGMTVYFTIRKGGDAKKIAANLKYNYLVLISTEWWRTK